MKLLLCMAVALSAVAPLGAQRVVCLDSCRAMALSNNKQMAVARQRTEAAANMRRSARTQYLPRIGAVGGYVHSNREISLLSDAQKATLSSIGTSMAEGINGTLQSFAAGLTAEQATQLNALLEPFGTDAAGALASLGGNADAMAQALNAQGHAVADAFRTDTRNIYAGAVMLTQPLYMGGSIRALNRMATIGEQMAANGAEAQRQATLYNTDRAYWTIVSLSHKRRLAESYLALVRQLHADMGKLIREGMATRSEGLTVRVRLNEAEMTLAQVADGLAMARMALCQLCGLPLHTDIVLPEESADSIGSVDMAVAMEPQQQVDGRPDLRLLGQAVQLSEQATRLVRSANLPQVALIGGYAFSNPNVYNGFRNRFGGAWSVGVMVRVPIWNWGDVAYKVRAARGASVIAQLQLEEAREGAQLQVSQSWLQLNQAHSRLLLAKASVEQAEENLRAANLGFSEGVMQSTTVMEAQAAWLKARSQRIDAEIDMMLGQTALKRALGTL